MNIIHVYRSMGQGGAQKVILQLCKAQRYDKNRVWVISSGGIYEEELKAIGVTHVTIPDIASKKPTDILKCIKAIRTICKEAREAVVHTHHRSAALYAQIATRGLKDIHLLYTSHNVFTGKRKMLRYALRKTVVVSVGDDVKKNLTDYYNLPKEQVLVIRNSVEKPDTKNVRPIIDRQEGFTYVCFIGRITEIKGVDVLLKAFAKVEKAEQNVKLVIIGDGEKADEYKKLTCELDLEGVYFAGYKKDAARFIEQFDFVVLPSWQEGFPLSIIEAFASAKPVIASDIPGNNELVEEGKNGFLFTPGETDELADKILQLCNEHDRCIKMGQTAQEEYENNFSYHVFIDKYKAAYRIAGVNQ